MSRFYTVEIKVGGRPCHGDWHLLQDGRLQVGSAWGSATVEIHEDNEPKGAAQLVLERILADYQAKRAEELKQQEREGQDPPAQ